MIHVLVFDLGFGEFLCCCLDLYVLSVGILVFVIGLSQISSLFSLFTD